MGLGMSKDSHRCTIHTLLKEFPKQQFSSIPTDPMRHGTAKVKRSQ
jgi:hypothetical protein